MGSNLFLPYGRQIVDEDDIQAVVDALSSDWLTTGPRVSLFEQAVCDYIGTKFGVAVNSGTSALHAAMYALGIGQGDEVIVPALTFAATANCVLYCKGVPIFADVNEDTLTIDPQHVESLITKKTKAIIAVDYAGCPCDWAALKNISEKYNLKLVADACHAIGARYKGAKVGTFADITVFSFHPVKHITTGEGGMLVTSDSGLAARAKMFRNHGITTDAHQREQKGAWHYEMHDLGFNYRITDIQCALGMSQLTKLDKWVHNRNNIAECYDKLLADVDALPLTKPVDVLHAYHLYVVRLVNRDDVFAKMRKVGIGVNVHYIPVYHHPYYENLGYKKGLCPVTEKQSKQILSLPMWAGMSKDDVSRVVELLK